MHRWRKLEGSDPATFELLQKVQLLHKRLIQGSEQLVERDLQIKEREELCHELQTIIKRAPGAEAGRQLLLTQVGRNSPYTKYTTSVDFWSSQKARRLAKLICQPISTSD